jgi:Protein of unknown function (DUF2868)
MFCYTENMKSTWRYRDIIDLEYFIHRDKERTSPEEQQEIRERDRRIYQDFIRQAADKDNDRRFLLLRWLTNRREQERAFGSDILPGQLTEEIYVRLSLLFSVTGIAFGIGAGLSFFTYTGASPLNVFHYLAAFVFLQLFILLILFISLTIRSRRRLPAPSLLSSLIAGLLIRLFQNAGRRLLSGIVAEKREGFLAILGIIKAKRIYSSLFFWPILILLQLFAVCFNTSLLAVTLFKVTVTDMAFGWQSTIQFSADAIYHFVRIMALPWSWFIEGGIAYPSLSEIEGSRIVLKDGIYHLATGNLVSWWPFLCFALCAYGLLPRIVLLLVALYKKGRTLAALRFDQPVFDRLLAGMRTPVISTRAEPEPMNAPASTPPGHVATTAAASRRGLTVMIPDDVFSRCSEAGLKQSLAKTGDFPLRTIRFGKDYESDRLLLESLASSGTEQVPVLVLTEAWLPPITDFMIFLHDLRRVLPQSTSIRIGLIGRPGNETVFTPVDSAAFRIWQKKMASLGDPYLSVEQVGLF